MKTRAKSWRIGSYVETDVVPIPDEEIPTDNRGSTGFATRPAQQLVNDRRTRKWMRLVMQGNFDKGDYFLTLTYKAGELPAPDNLKQAKKDLKDYLNKARGRYTKVGLECKYLWVMEYRLDEKEQYLEKVHFHIVMNKGISIEDIEQCWSRGSGKNRKQLGLINTKKIIKSADFGLEDLAEYLGKLPRNKKSEKIWNSSRNLKRPYKTKNDSKFTQRQLEKMALSNDQGLEILQKKYPGYRISYIKYKQTPYRGWHLYLRMWRLGAGEDG